MNKFSKTLCYVSFALGVASLAISAHAKNTDQFVEPSVTTIIKPGQRIAGSDYEHFVKDFMIQRIGKQTYWIYTHAYNSTVVIGKKGVMVIDAPRDGRGKAIIAAIRTLTDKPINTLVYSHYHFDHVGDANTFVEEAKKTETKLRIVGTSEAAKQIARYGDKVPTPTEVIDVPRGSFKFENMNIEMGTAANGHSSDSSWILLKEEKILHAVDMVHPTALVFPGFGMAEDLLGYENALKEMLTLDWNILSAGHSNIGNRGDIKLLLEYMQDIKMALGAAFKEAPMMPHVKPGDGVFYTWFMNHKNEVVAHAMNTMRPKWSKERAFEATTPDNIEKVMWHLYMH